MESIIVLEPIVFEDESMRRTGDGRVSVFDLIKVVGGQQNPKDVWKALCRDFPEVVDFSDYFKFPGKGQRDTPVVGKEGALIIIGILPGKAGKKYRAEAAKLVLAWYEAPADLAIAAIDRVDNAADAKAVLEKAAEKYLTTYHPLFDELKARTGGDRFTYINANTLNTKVVLRNTPKGVVADRGGKNARSCLTAAEYGQFMVLQDCQHSALSNASSDISGGSASLAIIKEVAADFDVFLSKYKK